jgi:hypothetical protein
MTTVRAQRMIDSAPGYYQESRTYGSIQQAIADELDRLGTATDDLQLQLRATTATWGLSLWEARYGLPIDDGNTYDLRRKKVLARIRSKAPFSVALIKGIAEIYTQRPVTVQFDRENMQVVIVMDRETNTSPQLFAAIDNIIHAHLGVKYRAAWVYESGINIGWSYAAIAYPFQAFASNTLYCGVPYDGPKVVNLPMPPVYDSGERIAQTFERVLQASFPITGALYAGGLAAPVTVIPVNQAVTYSGGEKIAATYSTTQQAAFKLTGTINTGTGEM